MRAQARPPRPNRGVNANEAVHPRGMRGRGGELEELPEGEDPFT